MDLFAEVFPAKLMTESKTSSISFCALFFAVALGLNLPELDGGGGGGGGAGAPFGGGGGGGAAEDAGGGGGGGGGAEPPEDIIPSSARSSSASRSMLTSTILICPANETEDAKYTQLNLYLATKRWQHRKPQICLVQSVHSCVIIQS